VARYPTRVPLLAYCMLLAPLPAELPATGVRGSTLEELQEAELRAVYSRIECAPDERWTRDDALAFHAVLRRLFERAAIVPFRFPTVLRDELELREYVRKSAPEHVAALARLADTVQMEIKIESSKSTAPGMTGAQYLRARGAERERVEATAAAARAALGELAREWRERESGDGMRCFALVARSQAADFQRRAAALVLAEGVTVVVSGPWPAMEFLAPPAPVANDG